MLSLRQWGVRRGVRRNGPDLQPSWSTCVSGSRDRSTSTRAFTLNFADARLATIWWPWLPHACDEEARAVRKKTRKNRTSISVWGSVAFGINYPDHSSGSAWRDSAWYTPRSDTTVDGSKARAGCRQVARPANLGEGQKYISENRREFCRTSGRRHGMPSRRAVRAPDSTASFHTPLPTFQKVGGRSSGPGDFSRSLKKGMALECRNS